MFKETGAELHFKKKNLICQVFFFMRSMPLFMGVLNLNFVIASLPHVRGRIDFRGGLINLLQATGALPSQERRYSLITPFQSGKLMAEAAL